MEAIKKTSEEEKESSDKLESLLNLELVEMEIGYGLVELMDANQDGDFLERVNHMRKQFALSWGVIVPSVKDQG